MSSRLKVNPDNVATPIAASLGDLITLALLATFASFFHRSMGSDGDVDPKQDLKQTSPPVPLEDDLLVGSVVLAAFLVLLPLVAAYADRDPQAKQILRKGWTPGKMKHILHI